MNQTRCWAAPPDGPPHWVRFRPSRPIRAKRKSVGKFAAAHRSDCASGGEWTWARGCRSAEGVRICSCLPRSDRIWRRLPGAAKIIPRSFGVVLFWRCCWLFGFYFLNFAPFRLRPRFSRLPLLSSFGGLLRPAGPPAPRKCGFVHGDDHGGRHRREKTASCCWTLNSGFAAWVCPRGEAMIQAGRRRLRPICMTALATDCWNVACWLWRLARVRRC